jgi:hypothetical protein
LEIIEPGLRRQLDHEVSRFKALPPNPEGVAPSLLPMIMDIDIVKDDGSKTTISVSRSCEVACIVKGEGQGWYSVDKEKSPLLRALVSVLEARPTTRR